MIAYIILAIALLVAIGAIYVIYNTQKTEKPVKVDSSGNNTVEQEISPPYATEEINSVDDYEYSMIFQNEGDRGLTKATRDRLMSQYPMDWTTQPPSSARFQDSLAKFKESFTTQELPSKTPYTSIDGDMIPPVYTDEKDILATYVPKKPNELTTYDAADAKEIVDRIYGAKGLVADLKKTGDNTYTVMTTRKKDAPVIYEAEEGEEDASGSNAHAPASSQPTAGEAIVVPNNVESYKGSDPFFTVNPNNRTRDGKWDYSSWTPGLERMFAPTEPQTNWY
jgi:hypothetical protein